MQYCWHCWVNTTTWTLNENVKQSRAFGVTYITRQLGDNAKRNNLISQGHSYNYLTSEKESITKWSRPYKLHCEWIEGVYCEVKQTLQTTLRVNWRSLLRSEADPTNYTAKQSRAVYTLQTTLWVKRSLLQTEHFVTVKSHSSDSTLLFNDNQEFQGQSIAYVGFKSWSILCSNTVPFHSLWKSPKWPEITC